MGIYSNRCRKLAKLDRLLHQWPSTNEAGRYARHTACALKLIDDPEIQEYIITGMDESIDVRTIQRQRSTAQRSALISGASSCALFAHASAACSLLAAVLVLVLLQSELSLLYVCAQSPNVPLQIPLCLLTLGELDMTLVSCGPQAKRMDRLASAVYHRAAQTQIALITCTRLQLAGKGVQVQWYEDGYAEGREVAGAWPTQRENQAAGQKQSLWWRDSLDAAFRYIFLAREYYVQLASGQVSAARNGVRNSYGSATTRKWENSIIGHKSLLHFVECKLAAVQPRMLMLVYLLMTKGMDAAKEYAYGRRAGKQPSCAKMAKAILKRVKVSPNERLLQLHNSRGCS
jgi:hypothetical protein